MKAIRNNLTCKGTRILLGNEKRNLINNFITECISLEFEEIQIPIIQFQKLFKDKVGQENNNLMFNFIDRGNREVCLAPEYTAVIQNLAQTLWKFEKNKRVFYVQECFRGENPQKGRYRQFTQFGVEVINPTEDNSKNLELLAFSLINNFTTLKNLQIDSCIKRGLDYYEDGKGFEIRSEDGMQLCGGGNYENGCGFAIGIDRLI